MTPPTPERRKLTAAVHAALILLLPLFIGGTIGCGDDSPPSPPVFPDFGTKLDGEGGVEFPVPPKYDLGWTPPDYGTPPDAGPSDATPSDGTPPSDGSVQCPAPSVTCTPPCGSNSTCTAASGGSCAKTYTLAGAATDKAVLREVALAYAECDAKKPSADTLCGTFDACNLQGAVTESMVKTWLCDAAQISDFPTSSVYDKARDIAGCGWLNDAESDWKVASISSGKLANICIYYDKRTFPLDDHIAIDLCSLFPPP